MYNVADCMAVQETVDVLRHMPFASVVLLDGRQAARHPVPGVFSGAARVDSVHALGIMAGGHAGAMHAKRGTSHDFFGFVFCLRCYWQRERETMTNWRPVLSSLDLPCLAANKGALIAAGAIPALVRLLNNSSGYLQSKAARALGNLACGHSGGFPAESVHRHNVVSAVSAVIATMNGTP